MYENQIAKITIELEEAKGRESLHQRRIKWMTDDISVLKEEKQGQDKKIEDQNKKIELLTKHYSNFQDLVNDFAEGGKNPIKIQKQTPAESAAMKKKSMKEI